METTRLRQNGWEIITTRFGGRLVESEIRTEHLSSTLAIVRRVVTFLETSTQVQLTAQNSISGTRWFQLVEIHWESKCRVLRLLPPLTANSQIRVVAKQSSKCSVMISTYWRSHISELPGHANPESISSYSLNLLEKQRLISNKLAGFNPSTTTINSDSSHALREIVLKCSAPPSNTAHTSNCDGSASRSIYLMEGAVGGMFTGVTFNNSPVNISINFQSNITWISDSLKEKQLNWWLLSFLELFFVRV